MGYFKRNIVPGRWRHEKGGKQVRNPGYDVNQPQSLRYWSTERVKLGKRWVWRYVPYQFTWYKPKGKPTKRKNKRGQSKPR